MGNAIYTSWVKSGKRVYHDDVYCFAHFLTRKKTDIKKITFYPILPCQSATSLDKGKRLTNFLNIISEIFPGMPGKWTPTTLIRGKGLEITTERLPGTYVNALFRVLRVLQEQDGVVTSMNEWYKEMLIGNGTPQQKRYMYNDDDIPNKFNVNSRALIKKDPKYIPYVAWCLGNLCTMTWKACTQSPCHQAYDSGLKQEGSALKDAQEQGIFYKDTGQYKDFGGPEYMIGGVNNYSSGLRIPNYDEDFNDGFQALWKNLTQKVSV